MSKDFLELLNKEENQWEQQDQINDGLPYLKNLKPNS
jgi:hypothetical protein